MISSAVTSLLRIFPYLENKNLASELKIDEESIYFISHRKYAEKITNIIKDKLPLINKNAKDIIITDATAGVGGNTLSFGTNFKHVHAIELEETRFNYLRTNTSVYKLDNITFYHDNCLNVIYNILDHDIIFFDPPWGGKTYKESKTLRLTLDEISLEEICNNLFDETKTKNPPKIIVLKLPNNYDIKYFYKVIKSEKIYFFDLKKMYILVVINQ